MTEGYLLLAVGPARYVEMARNLAASLKVMDGSRNVCLVHDTDAELRAGDHLLFDDLAVLEPDDRYPGFMNKLRLYACSPYGVTMVVDVDCLLARRDVDRYWEQARNVPFLITGEPRTRGAWNGADVAHLLAQTGARYIVRMNSGVFTFRRCEAAERFFEGLQDFYLQQRDRLKLGPRSGEFARTDEIYFGLWMGLTGLQGWTRGGRADSWMVSTWRAVSLHLDPGRGVAILRKPRRAFAGVPNPLGGWDRLSPTFVHFIGLRPRRAYENAAAYFRSRVALRS